MYAVSVTLKTFSYGKVWADVGFFSSLSVLFSFKFAKHEFCASYSDLSSVLAAPPTRPTYQQDPKQTTPTPFDTLDSKLPAAISTLYLAGLVAIFLLAAFLHPFEAYCLLHGLWYLLCLPSGYLLLIIYSVCNMTDRSWG